MTEATVGAIGAGMNSTPPDGLVVQIQQSVFGVVLGLQPVVNIAAVQLPEFFPPIESSGVERLASSQAGDFFFHSTVVEAITGPLRERNRRPETDIYP